MILIPISCNFFFGSPSANNSEVKCAWPGSMGDQPGSSSRVRTSEDKVRRKDLYWSVRAVYILVKLPDVSGPSLGEVGRYRREPLSVFQALEVVPSMLSESRLSDPGKPPGLNSGPNQCILWGPLYTFSKFKCSPVASPKFSRIVKRV